MNEEALVEARAIHTYYGAGVADRVVILVKGATVYDGSNAELRGQPELHQRYLGV